MQALIPGVDAAEEQRETQATTPRFGTATAVALHLLWASCMNASKYQDILDVIC